MHIYDNIWLDSSYSEKYFRQNLFTKPKHTIYIQKVFSKIHAIYEIMNKNMIEPDRP